MKKLLYSLILVLAFVSHLKAQTYVNVGNTLQRAPTAKGYIYRFNLGAPGFAKWYTTQQIDSLLLLAGNYTASHGIKLVAKDIQSDSTNSPFPTKSFVGLNYIKNQSAISQSATYKISGDAESNNMIARNDIIGENNVRAYNGIWSNGDYVVDNHTATGTVPLAHRDNSGSDVVYNLSHIGSIKAALPTGVYADAVYWNPADSTFHWGAAASGSGTVTSVTSANSDIGVANTTTTPVLTLNSGSGANQIVKRDVSGNLNATTVTTNANLTGAVTSIGNATLLGSFSSANLATALTDETGSGVTVFSGSPALTGIPTAPTASGGTNTTQIATTAFVLANSAPGGSDTQVQFNNSGAFGGNSNFTYASNTLSVPTVNITGTSGYGPLDLISQSASPNSVTGHLRIYADSLNRFSWKNSTYRRTIQVPKSGDVTIRMPYLLTPTLADSSQVATSLATKQVTVSLTTTGTVGASTFNPSTGALNIPQYTGGGGSTIVPDSVKSTESLINNVTWTGAALNAKAVVINGYLYVCEYANSKIGVFDVSVSGTPRLINEFTVGTNPRTVKAIGNRIIVSCFGGNKLEIYDVSNPQSATQVTSVTTGSGPKDFVIVNSYLYLVCSGAATVEKWQLWNNYSSLTKISQVSTATLPWSISYGNGLLAVVGGSSTLNMYTESTFASISTTTLSGSTSGTCAFYGDNVLVTDNINNTLVVYGVDNPASPSLITSITTQTAPEEIRIVGQRAYIPSLTPSGHGYLNCIDLTNPRSPVRYLTLNTNNGGSGFSAQNGEYLYVTGHYTPFTLDIFKISPEIYTTQKRDINPIPTFQPQPLTKADAPSFSKLSIAALANAGNSVADITYTQSATNQGIAWTGTEVLTVGGQQTNNSSGVVAQLIVNRTGNKQLAFAQIDSLSSATSGQIDYTVGTYKYGQIHVVGGGGSYPALTMLLGDNAISTGLGFTPLLSTAQSNIFTAGSDSRTSLKIQKTSSATGNMLDFANSSATVLSNFNSSGFFGFGQSAVRPIGILDNTSNRTDQIRYSSSTSTSIGHLGQFGDATYLFSGGCFSGGWTGDNASRAIGGIVVAGNNANSNISFQLTTTNNANPPVTHYFDGGGKAAFGNGQTLGSALLTLGSTTVQGSLGLKGLTSGEAVLVASAIAGTTTITVPRQTSMLATLALSETLTNKKLASSNDTIGAVNMVLGSDATGDIYYRNSTAQLTRLGIGGSTTVLHGGTTPSYSAVSLTADVSGVLPAGNLPTTIPNSASNNDLTAQTTAGNITTFTVGASTATFNVSVYINVTAVATDVIQAQITYTDENNVSQTVSLASLSTVTNSTYNPTTIRAKNATVITLKTNLTTGIGSITFDAGGCITKMY